MLDFINPRIGTGKRGNCLIGPCLPFGTVRLGPDIAYPQPNSGYRPGKAILGFSHTRLAGTGGAGRYGNIRVMPFVGEAKRLAGPPYITFPATDRNWSKPVEEHAEVGLYRCRFSFGIQAELSTTMHVGVHRYEFPPETTAPQLLIDFSALLQAGVAPAGQTPYCEDWEMEGHCVGCDAELVSSREISGCSMFHGGWGHFYKYPIYYFIRAREDWRKFQFFASESPETNRISGANTLRAVIAFASGTRTVELEAGISFNSAAEARHFVETESRGQSIEEIHVQAREAWRPYIDLIETDGGTDDQKALLATSMLRLFTLPTALTSESKSASAESAPQRFTDITCLWDSIRNANSLYHLIAPGYSAALMNSLLCTADETGWLPDADIAGHFAYQQSGCSAEILFSEAARKGVPGVDYHRALAACVRNAETPSPAPSCYGRYLEDYETLGYLSTNVPKGCVSRHIEYTYQDWCIARLAELLGEMEIATRFDRKANRLWNLWNDEAKCFLPRRPDGSWVEGVLPEHHNWDGWNDPYSYESSLGYWSFSGLHDIEGLIKRHGGKAAFASFLDVFLSKNSRTEKETRMHIPHLYALAGRPERAADIIHRSLETSYANHADGLPDDEDMGCQSAYYICNAMGLYPIYGRTYYSLVPPLFERSVLRYGLADNNGQASGKSGRAGKSLTITRRGAGPHIKEVHLNGQEIQGTILEHAQICEGGTLEIAVG